VKIRLPNNWEPRGYQKKAWNYWVRDGGLHSELIWHRRSGKDEIALHGTAIKAHERVANYWHMLPLANQVRKAIWEAVNPRSGKRRIDEAFPDAICETKRDQDMLIRFRNGSTWQCLGSDNYQGAIGSTPAGIVYSEWAQANPSSRGYLRPILAENKGWQMYITTPRGKNHAYSTYNGAKKNANSFAQLLTVDDTDVFSPEMLAEERIEYINTYGKDMGHALFEQEYYCSFEAAILGAVWGGELAKLVKEGRYTNAPHNPEYPVFTAWDIGRTDSTAIWFYQVIGNEVIIIDFYQNNLKDPDHYASQILGKEVKIDLIADKVVVNYGEIVYNASHRQEYQYECHWLPHDARAKTFAAKGKSIQQQLNAVFTWQKVKIVPSLSRIDGINATRAMLRVAIFDESTEEGFEAIKQYRYDWDDDKKKFRDIPVHDWTSHPSDALRMMAIAWKHAPTSEPVKVVPITQQPTLNELLKLHSKNQKHRSRRI
jgi:phage terminase large subunit